ncbi:Cobalamin synthase [Roseovarius tolerans]|uniref:Adenosylcobinamide-GDP ribazoletransferase n=1 Tax=Roseovarius tolerans TaxID=74031 RepID=A0A0L6CSR5_9RHOB|nr:adenosylcobinamide-GDP ribazoletransferase [Roseovarius tolerans]KNX40553.1 Cobalamin synthase [Roseovarius tolerans]
MAENDTALIRAGDIALALSLLSRLPVRCTCFARGARAAWAYPLAGLVMGGLAALGGLVALWCGLPAPLVALVVLTLGIVSTGAMHEDGLADSADGLWGGWTQQRRLEIMRDSHIGSYGVIALCLSLAARGIALWLLFAQSPAAGVAGVLAAATLSRAAMAGVMAALPHARADGLSHSQGRAPMAAVLLGLGLSIGGALILAGGAGLWALLWAGLVTVAVAALARARIGGQTGDILGATQQMVEIAVLVSLLA